MNTNYTNGWDTIVATSQANLNSALKLGYDAGILPRSAKIDVPVSFFGIKVLAVFDVQLGAWSIAGGSGENVRVSIPFTGGTLTVGTASYPMAGVVMVVTCILTYVKSPVVTAGGTKYVLQINFSSREAIMAVQARNSPAGLTLNDMDAVLLRFLQDALGGNTFDVAEVSLGGFSESYPYLVPKLMAYAMTTNDAEPDRSTFAVMMLTTSTTPGLRTVVEGTIPGGEPVCDSAALVSNRIFVENVLLPGIAESLGVSPSKLAVRMAGGSWMVVNSGTIKVKADRDPELTSLTASVVNDVLRFDFVGKVEASPGIRVDFSIQSKYALRLRTSDGVQIIDLVKQGEPVVHHTVKAEPWVIAVTAAAAIAAIAATAMFPLVGLLAAAVGFTVVFAIVAIANNEAGALLADSMPATVAGDVRWTNLGIFTVRQALMPMPLQLGGVVPALGNR